MDEQDNQTEATESVSEKAGYEWLLKTDFMGAVTNIWEGLERVAGEVAENQRLDRDEFVAGCANAFIDAMNDFLFGEEEEGESEEG